MRLRRGDAHAPGLRRRLPAAATSAPGATSKATARRRLTTSWRRLSALSNRRPDIDISEHGRGDGPVATAVPRHAGARPVATSRRWSALVNFAGGLRVDRLHRAGSTELERVTMRDFGARDARAQSLVLWRQRRVLRRRDLATHVPGLHGRGRARSPGRLRHVPRQLACDVRIGSRVEDLASGSEPLLPPAGLAVRCPIPRRPGRPRDTAALRRPASHPSTTPPASLPS